MENELEAEVPRLKLYLITCGDYTYDEYEGFVIAASNKKEAFEFAQEKEWGNKKWNKDNEKVDCERIGKAAKGTESGIVLASFFAGIMEDKKEIEPYTNKVKFMKKINFIFVFLVIAFALDIIIPFTISEANHGVGFALFILLCIIFGCASSFFGGMVNSYFRE